MPPSPRIAIIGAGPAGLTLARLLHAFEIRVDITVYERDALPTSRPDQGGSLDLHTETGLAAIRACGLWDEFEKHARYEGQELIFVDKNSTKLVHVKSLAGERERPEMDRKKLKEVLLESLPEGCVRWGMRLREVTEEGILRFDAKEEVEGPFDLIVGAEGAWSKVRDKVCDVKPGYAGVCGFEMDIPHPEKTCPHVDNMVGQGMYFGSSDRKMLNAQRMGNRSIKTRTWFTCPEGEAKETLEKYGKEKIREKLLERYADWAPEMTEFLRQADLSTLRLWHVYELPVGCKWEHKKGFTLIGDAASLSAPFGGDGVNKAMKDALDLAELIEKSQLPDADITLDEAVLIYEEMMFPRAEKLQAMAMENKQTMFGPTAPIGLMTGMLRKKASESSSIPMKLLGSAPVIALIFSYFWLRQQIGWAVRRFWWRT